MVSLVCSTVGLQGAIPCISAWSIMALVWFVVSKAQFLRLFPWIVVICALLWVSLWVYLVA